MKKLLSCILGLIALAACGSSETKKSNQIGTNSTSYTYQLKENGCDTGKHTFETLSEYCTGLKDSALNHGCATDLRSELYNRNCTAFGVMSTSNTKTETETETDTSTNTDISTE